MKKDLIIVMQASKRGERLMPVLEKQLKAAEIEYHVDPLDATQDWHKISTLEYSINRFRDLAMRFGLYDRIISIDAFDMLFFGTKTDIIEKFPVNFVLFAAEKNCFGLIDPELSDIRESLKSIPSPWRYVNGGGFAGTTETFLRLAYELENHPLYNPDTINQGFYNKILAKDKKFYFGVDFGCGLFHCHFESEGDIIVKNGKPYNKVSMSYPNFIHFNGHAPYHDFMKDMGMEAEIPKRKVHYLFLQPGDPSGIEQSSSLEMVRFRLFNTGKDCAVQPAKSANIFEARNRCLGKVGHRKDQKPFQGLYDYERLIWVDSDNIVTYEQVQRLIAHDVDIVGGWYSQYVGGEIGPNNLSVCGHYRHETRMPGVRKGFINHHVYTVADMLSFQNPETPQPEGSIVTKVGPLINVDYVGMGLVVMKAGVVEQLDFPWFRAIDFEWEDNGVIMCGGHGEDVGFFERLRGKGFKVFVDPLVKIGHQKKVIL